ncbi:MAG: beta-ketoacyl-ACP synthase II [Balneolaceae bacterium]|nr:beta-ketoacyl-ACP synthase II [Balneolaceae bacterium]MBO6545226.1 beta-ketoacyl-ACP synthase II [Balneolaceae bacterium]MBO6646622.1 beta-ketoacyl-ACP synthase II [Balneolaceae bacterium]
MLMKRVVITGLGAVTPIGNTVDEFWDSLKNGKSGAGPITKWDPEHYKTQFACELKDFDPSIYLDRNEIRKNDPYVVYALCSTQQAIDESGLDFDSMDRHRVGVIWGTGVGGFDSFEKEVMAFARGNGTPRFNPYFIVKTIPNMASGIISIKHGLMGINQTVISACATSNSAIMDAFNYIRLGKADVIISGGSEASITYAAMGGFSTMKALSQRNGDPASASRPFDTERDGFVMGEGSGALVLEDYDHAIARGANIIAEVLGASSTADAYHLSATHPEGLGAKTAMNLALEEAGLSISDIGYINAHATSTPVGDVSELKAIKSVIGNSGAAPKISSTKSMTGHLLGAAGAAEGIASIKAIQEGIIPPTINVENLDPEAEGLDIVVNEAVESEVNYAMSNTFGFGGHNAIVVFGKV